MPGSTTNELFPKTNVKTLANHVFPEKTFAIFNPFVAVNETLIFFFLLPTLESITSILLGENVTSIGQRCFEKFSQLTEIQFNERITEINQYAFYQSNITNLTIPNTITLIESHAFEDNKKGSASNI